MRWTLRASEPAAVSNLVREANLIPVVAQLLLARGVRTAEEACRFLAPKISDMHSPYAMAGMSAAVERLRAAIERRERVLIYGDYDVDGTTAVVILKTAIELCGGLAEFHVPHRIREGYGMKDEVIERAAADGVRVVISVDTGIRAFDAAVTARQLGLDLIITDHHLPAEGIPLAFAVLNPNQPGCEYPCKELCGAGVAFKLAQAILEKAGRERLLPSFLKMVALATIADAVPLIGENRLFAKLGLEGLRSPVNAGLRALLETSSLDGSRPLTATDVAFRLAPRLNAAGRMDYARDVIELFTVKDPLRARELAARLTQLNSERQDVEARILAEIETQIEADPALREAFCMVLDGEGWHRGVIGIIATRVVERYGRPALVLSRDGGEAFGSGRSIDAFHLMNALESCAPLFTRFGGHAHAAGFALPVERIAELRDALDAYARGCLTPADFEPVLELEAELPLAEITPDLFNAIARLEPFGAGNPQPVFAARGVRVLLPPRLLKEKHIKLRVSQPDAEAPRSTRPLDAMGWRLAERAQQQGVLAGDLLDIAFTVEHNTHPDFGGLELGLCDFVKTGGAAAAANGG